MSSGFLMISKGKNILVIPDNTKTENLKNQHNEQPEDRAIVPLKNMMYLLPNRGLQED